MSLIIEDEIFVFKNIEKHKIKPTTNDKEAFLKNFVYHNELNSRYF